MSNGDRLILGDARNTEEDRTSITKTQGFLPVLDLYNDFGVGLLIISGQSEFHEGRPATGEALAAFSPGIAVNADGGTTGVRGIGKKKGVEGSCDQGVGVYGHSREETGVRGEGSFGVVGSSANERGVGVRGEASGDWGTGVYGLAGSMGIGVHASATGEESTALYAFGGGGAVAGYFQGRVYVEGDLTVRGRKAAIVPHPDGSYRELYALESPECWFEDFGRAELKNGKVRVELQPEFAAIIDSKVMHIFLSPEGNCNGLYVSSKSGKGFSVRELQGGSSSISFSYRIVGRRKDIRIQRLEKVRLPERHAVPQAKATPVKPEPGEVREKSFYTNKVE